MSLKNEISELLGSIADILEFRGDNPFKITAYRNGSNIVRQLTEDLETMIEDGSIKQVKGIGKGILAIITEYYQTGACEEYMQLLGEVPPGISDLLRIRGLGARKIKYIYDELGIGDIDHLEAACRNNLLSGLKGFGEKSQLAILSEIERVKAASDYVLMPQGDREAALLLEQIRSFQGVLRAEVSGEIRRSMEIVSRIDIVALVEDKDRLRAQLNVTGMIADAMPEMRSGVLSNGNFPSYSLLTQGLLPAFVFLAQDEAEFQRLLFLTTGADGFLEASGVKAAELSGASEKALFEAQGLSFVMPEMRESGYFELSEGQRRNTDLSFSDFRGFMHFHSTFSDGREELIDMVMQARRLGFEYYVVCDHSKAAFYASGLKEDAILEQAELVKKLRREHGLAILQGIESDILSDGSLDYDESVLSTLSFVVASVHSRFSQSEDEMTRRIIRAVENPYTDVLGHPTGRLLLERDPYRVDIRKVIDACAANSVAIEINAHPNRLDLDWRNIYYAREKGCRFSINPDAHTLEGILDTNYGIRIARKGGIQKDEVINCYDLTSFREFLNRKVTRKIPE